MYFCPGFLEYCWPQLNLITALGKWWLAILARYPIINNNLNPLAIFYQIDPINTKIIYTEYYNYHIWRLVRQIVSVSFIIRIRCWGPTFKHLIQMSYFSISYHFICQIMNVVTSCLPSCPSFETDITFDTF